MRDCGQRLHAGDDLENNWNLEPLSLPNAVRVFAMTDSSQARQIAEQWLDEHWTEHAFTAKWTNRHKMNVPDQTSLPELLTSFAAHTRRSEALREAAEVVGCRLCRKGVPIDGKSSDSAEERK